MKIGKLDTAKQHIVVAELGANHAGSLEVAKKSIKAAFESGADAIKLQTFRAQDMTLECKNEEFMIKGGTLWDGKTLFELYEWAKTPLEWHAELFAYARSLGMEIFSTPFSKEMVDFLEQFDPPAYKIASFELIDYDLVEYTAKKQKPIIISTGIATLEEIEEAIKICKSSGNSDIMILKCTSQYPAPLHHANLQTIVDMQKRFGVEVGFSDHTEGIIAPIVALSLGATLIEKHFVIDKSLDAPDASFSITPDELKEMSEALKKANIVKGKVDYELPPESKSSRNFARSLYFVNNLKKGDIIKKEDIKSIRPGLGLHPKYLSEVIGKKATKDIKACEKVKLSSFDI